MWPLPSKLDFVSIPSPTGTRIWAAESSLLISPKRERSSSPMLSLRCQILGQQGTLLSLHWCWHLLEPCLLRMQDVAPSTRVWFYPSPSAFLFDQRPSDAEILQVQNIWFDPRCPSISVKVISYSLVARCQPWPTEHCFRTAFCPYGWYESHKIPLERMSTTPDSSTDLWPSLPFPHAASIHHIPRTMQHLHLSTPLANSDLVPNSVHPTPQGLGSCGTSQWCVLLLASTRQPAASATQSPQCCSCTAGAVLRECG